MSGRSNIIQKARDLDTDLGKDQIHSARILKRLQRLEHDGYHFEAAEASLELLIKRMMKKFKDFFEIKSFEVSSAKNKGGRMVSNASVLLKVGKVAERTSSAGDGPVNALDGALRKALKKFYPNIARMHLTDYKVRVLDEKQGTAAKVRVLIQSQDEDDSWWTIGVSENIIDAS